MSLPKLELNENRKSLSRLSHHFHFFRATTQTEKLISVYLRGFTDCDQMDSLFLFQTIYGTRSLNLQRVATDQD